LPRSSNAPSSSSGVSICGRSPLRAAAAYLAGAAAGAVSPTPGGLGAVDAALTGVLIRLGAAGAAAATCERPSQDGFW
jgi:hypothetical protein